LLTGIVLGVVNVFGGFVGRWLDHNLGPVNALRIELSMAILAGGAAVGMAPDRILYFWSYDAAAHGPLWEGPVFRTLPDLIVLLLSAFSGIFIAGQYASSRTALVRLAPPALTGAFFGVFALSGAATAWLAPSLVNIGTRLTHTQQGGFIGILGLLVAGLIGLFFVKGGGRETTEVGVAAQLA
jgi:UMF1 family MFS transporter